MNEGVLSFTLAVYLGCLSILVVLPTFQALYFTTERLKTQAALKVAQTKVVEDL